MKKGTIDLNKPRIEAKRKRPTWKTDSLEENSKKKRKLNPTSTLPDTNSINKSKDDSNLSLQKPVIRSTKNLRNSLFGSHNRSNKPNNDDSRARDRKSTPPPSSMKPEPKTPPRQILTTKMIRNSSDLYTQSVYGKTKHLDPLQTAQMAHHLYKAIF